LRKRESKFFEIAPRKVKQAIVGYGAAQKSAVAKMVQRLLNLPKPARARRRRRVGVGAGSCAGKFALQSHTAEKNLNREMKKRKTSNIEHRTLKAERLVRGAVRCSAFDVRRSMFPTQ